MATELLATYLNDHLATATAARELARRSATANRGGEHGAFLERVAGELDEQLAALGATMDALGVSPDRVKQAAAWTAEKAGRLKPNGRLRGYSPLSRVVELEALSMLVTHNLALWQGLDELTAAQPSLDGPDARRQADQCAQQLQELQAQRRRAVTQARAG